MPSLLVGPPSVRPPLLLPPPPPFEYRRKDEENSRLWRTMIVIYRQNRRNVFLILILSWALSLSLYFSLLYNKDFNLRLLRNLKCSQDELRQPWKTWKQRARPTDNLFYLFEKQLMRYKALTRVYGEFFMLPEATIRKATEDERLWNAVKNVFETEPNFSYVEQTSAPSTEPLQPNLDSSLKIDLSWKIIDPGDKKNTQDTINIFDVFVPAPKSKEEKFLRKGKFQAYEHELSFPVDATFDKTKLKTLFQQLTGETAEAYVRKRMSSFGQTGTLNLWKYLVVESINKSFSDLERSSTLEDASDIESVSEKASELYPARTSADGKYLLYDRMFTGPQFVAISGEHKVTVTTQMSMDRLPTFVESYQYWNGPISLAVFLHGPMEYFVFRSYLSFIHRCFPRQFERTRFSIATPINDPIPRDAFIQTTDFDSTDCSAKSAVIKEVLKTRLTKSNKWLKSKWYPQNMMRNLARYNIITDYQITLDVDIFPCPKMSEGLNVFLNTSRQYDNALVVPTYEVSKKVKFPHSKNELMTLVKKRMAQPFHKDIYLPNQNATNFPKWEKLYDSFEPVHVVHEVHQFPIHYEPFFVEHNSSPLYDEGFVGYGFTRSSHAYEMFIKNGNFLILSPIYTVQLGILKVKEWSDARHQQNEYNRRRFDNLIHNMRNASGFTRNSTQMPLRSTTLSQ